MLRKRGQFGEDSKGDSLITSPVFLILLCLFLSFCLYNFYKGFETVQLMQERMQRLENKISKLQAENQQLAREIGQINSPEYLEKISREELGLVKPGEIMVITVPVDPNSS
ncbi:MAG: septum formation initiator family protein [Halanaerobium sp.]|nr:septum formation initiator family protein [Halanaerobium sp.]